MDDKKVWLSQNETDVLGFKVSRYNEDNFDSTSLLKEIVEGQYDLCRLKIPAEDELASDKLHLMGMPFFFSGSIRRYKTPIKSKPEGEFVHPDMTYEVYDGSQEELLMEMLKGTWGDYPLGYYRTPYLKHLVNKDSEIESVFKFYKRNNLNSFRSENSILFMNHNGNYVGFFALNIIDGGLESHIGGILEPFRKGGYFLDMLRYIKNFCVDNGLSHFAFGARNENAYVQKIFQDVGFRPIGSENVFHILPMLSLTQEDNMVVQSNDFSLNKILFYADIFVKKSIDKFEFKEIKYCSIQSVGNLQNELIFSMPIKFHNEFLVVAKRSVQGSIITVFYISGSF
ncbi:MAG: hypothetical protein M9958_00775 [Chitinophagales bacterium]|nr:hypothetical protein [Chitinophagales bacterium]